MTNPFSGEGDRSVRRFVTNISRNTENTVPLPVAVHLMEMFQ